MAIDPFLQVALNVGKKSHNTNNIIKNYITFFLQLLSRFAYIMSCEWLRCDGGFMWKHTSTTHNSPIVLYYMAPALLFFHWYNRIKLWVHF